MLGLLLECSLRLCWRHGRSRINIHLHVTLLLRCTVHAALALHLLPWRRLLRANTIHLLLWRNVLRIRPLQIVPLGGRALHLLLAFLHLGVYLLCIALTGLLLSL